MKDDTVRRLQALAEEYPIPTDAERDDTFDEVFADHAMFETVHGDAA
jgi:hypothetical protein